MYKRHPFLYFNDLAIIVGNDMANGTQPTTTIETKDCKLFDEAIDLDDDRDFNMPMDGSPTVDEEFIHENISSASIR